MPHPEDSVKAAAERLSQLVARIACHDSFEEADRAYTWEDAFRGAQQLTGQKNANAIFTTAYIWYHGAHALCETAHERIRQDVADYLDGAGLPDYMFRLYELGGKHVRH